LKDLLNAAKIEKPCLSLWERWPSIARTERANLVLDGSHETRPSQSPTVTALPKGEPRELLLQAIEGVRQRHYCLNTKKIDNLYKI
jgi:hypothetical protein